MTVAESVKDAVGLGGSGPGKTASMLDSNRELTTVQLLLQERRCRQRNYLCRTETAVRTSSYRSTNVE